LKHVQTSEVKMQLKRQSTCNSKKVYIRVHVLQQFLSS